MYEVSALTLHYVTVTSLLLLLQLVLKIGTHPWRWQCRAETCRNEVNIISCIVIEFRPFFAWKYFCFQNARIKLLRTYHCEFREVRGTQKRNYERTVQLAYGQLFREWQGSELLTGVNRVFVCRDWGKFRKNFTTSNLWVRFTNPGTTDLDNMWWFRHSYGYYIAHIDITSFISILCLVDITEENHGISILCLVDIKEENHGKFYDIEPVCQVFQPGDHRSIQHVMVPSAIWILRHSHRYYVIHIDIMSRRYNWGKSQNIDIMSRRYNWGKPRKILRYRTCGSTFPFRGPQI